MNAVADNTIIISLLFRGPSSNSTDIEDVVDAINNGGTCEGMQGYELSGEDIAGQYAAFGVKDFGDCPEDDIEASLEHYLDSLIQEHGARFDYVKAIAVAKEVYAALVKEDEA